METVTIQPKFVHLGKMLSEKRMETGLSVEECARFINREASEYENFESGSDYPSLIELEALAYLFNVLPESFWEDQPEQQESLADKTALNFEMIARIRRRTIGLNLRQARIEAGVTTDMLVDQLKIKPEDLNAYEMGLRNIPVDQLALAAEICGASLDAFLDRKSPIGSWAENHRMAANLSAMPYELKEFVSRPINQPYLELAKKLSEMPVHQLREIAEGLLEITL